MKITCIRRYSLVTIILSHRIDFFVQYSKALKSSESLWEIGYRIEDLELKVFTQHNQTMAIKKTVDSLPSLSNSAHSLLRHHLSNMDILSNIRESRIAVHHLLYNDSMLYRIRCESSGNLLRVGLNDFRADSRDECQLFTSASSQSFGPHTVFHIIQSYEGSFALRSLATGLFVKAVPPPSNNVKAPWKLVVGGAIIGSAEIFRQSDEGYLYSPLMGNYIIKLLINVNINM